jgi:hypothetical protein
MARVQLNICALHNKGAILIGVSGHLTLQISGYGMNPLLRAVDSLKSALQPGGSFLARPLKGQA